MLPPERYPAVFALRPCRAARNAVAWLPVLVALLVGCSCSVERDEGEAKDIAQAPADRRGAGTRLMAERLEALAQREQEQGGFTVGMDERVAARRRAVREALTFFETQHAQHALALELLRAGETREAIAGLEQIQAAFDERGMPNTLEGYGSMMATAHLRLGEQENCLTQHNADACLLPIRGGGIHQAVYGSRRAIEYLQARLAEDPDTLADRWLLNVAHMTLGEYPDKPPLPWRIDPAVFASEQEIMRFRNVAFDAGVAVPGLSGGTAMEDFDGDGDLDLVASSWGLRDRLRFYRNEGSGKFVERSTEAGLAGLVGGLNVSHADYDNDGDADLLVLRGAWLRGEGELPNSLLRNNGDGTFDDVTEAAGLLSFHPTQVGVWGDYDNDGWLDVFIGNESSADSIHRSELYRNDGDGTFTNVAPDVGLDLLAFVKGAAWGDFDNDGQLDLYVSRFGGDNLLLRNELRPDADRRFRDVATAAGVTQPRFSFPTWFFDMDNDGWLDLFVGSFPGFAVDSLEQVAAGYLGVATTAPTPRLFRNNGDGTFADVTARAGLDVPMLVMGSNFGDIDNDGWPDLYLGTGEPNLRTLVPNRMFRNAGGDRFVDVTASGGFGHLQKGHGVAFGDIDDDGDQDIYIVMGGAYRADFAYNALFLNPGNDHRWIGLSLEGVQNNRAGVGARIAVTVRTPRGRRTIMATVGTGGSFGSSSLRQEIGLGDATHIEALEVTWPSTRITQRFSDVPLDARYRVREGAARLLPLAQAAVSLPRPAPP